MSFTLRVNVGEQCQLECGYCRPSLARVTAKRARLSPAHYAQLAQAMAGAPPRKIRFTGGEPLLREDLPEVIAAFRSGLPAVPLAVTTNGALLSARLPELQRAGLGSATVHVDSLKAERYRELMGGGELARALEGVAAAKACFGQVKLNVVVQRGRNDDELGDFLEWSAREGVEVRFIELMNTGSAVAFTRAHFLSGAEVVRRLGGEPVPRRQPGDPAALFRARGVTFGVIASDTAPFCGACDRLRLSAAGVLRTCLYAPAGLDVGGLLRAGAGQGQLASALRVTLSMKRSHHPSLQRERAPFSMAAVGG